jgi:hypothetical protein
MRCSLGVIINVIGEMSEALKGRNRDFGFGELLHLKIDKLDDRALCLAIGRCRSQQKLFNKCLDYRQVGRVFLAIMLLIIEMLELN